MFEKSWHVLEEIGVNDLSIGKFQKRTEVDVRWNKSVLLVYHNRNKYSIKTP